MAATTPKGRSRTTTKTAAKPGAAKPAQKRTPAKTAAAKSAAAKPAPKRGAGTKPKALIVLGMHRSGTSAVTRLINLLGVELGDNLMPAALGNNETGFWEHQDAVRIDDQILGLLDRRWDDVRALPQGWQDRPTLKAPKEELGKVLKKDFAKAPVWGVKDPRQCRLVPLWREVLDGLGVEPLFLFVLRSPLEVAGSLSRRDGIPAEQSHLLWLRHLVEAEEATRDAKRFFIAYDDVLADWRGAADRIGKALGFDWPVRPETVAAEVDDFLNPGLRHHSVPSVAVLEDEALSAWVRDAYRLSLEEARDPKVSLQPVIDQIAAAERLFDPLAGEMMAASRLLEVRDLEIARRAREFDELRTNKDAEVKQVGRQIADLKKEIASRDKSIEGLNGELARCNTDLAVANGRIQELQRLNDRIGDMERQVEAFREERYALKRRLEGIEASTSWRLTAPLRWAMGKLRR